MSYCAAPPVPRPAFSHLRQIRLSWSRTAGLMGSTATAVGNRRDVVVPDGAGRKDRPGPSGDDVRPGTCRVDDDGRVDLLPAGLHAGHAAPPHEDLIHGGMDPNLRAVLPRQPNEGIVEVRRHEVPVARAVARLEHVVGSHVGDQLLHLGRLDPVDVEPERFPERDVLADPWLAPASSRGAAARPVKELDAKTPSTSSRSATVHHHASPLPCCGAAGSRAARPVDLQPRSAETRTRCRRFESWCDAGPAIPPPMTTTSGEEVAIHDKVTASPDRITLVGSWPARHPPEEGDVRGRRRRPLLPITPQPTRMRGCAGSSRPSVAGRPRGETRRGATPRRRPPPERAPLSARYRPPSCLRLPRGGSRGALPATLPPRRDTGRELDRAEPRGPGFSNHSSEKQASMPPS